jgi:EmrB/QacA subfamily drug resistance transporter
VTFSRRRIATIGIIGGNFLAAIEATIVATAMPTVVDHLGGLAHYAWVFSAYLLTATVTVPIWGKLSDLYGRRRLYLSAVALFVLGSALSGVSQTMAQLIVFRAVQGIGAGGLLPLGLTIIGDLYALHERARPQAWFSGVWGIASIVGPVVGGYVTETWSWRWVFYLNVPFGAVAAVLVGWALVEEAPHERPRIDYAGASLLTGAVTLLMVALSQTGLRGGALAPSALALMYVSAAVLIALFVRVERRVPEPILPLDLLANRLIGTATICGFLVGVAMFGALSFVPLFVQSALGGSATDAGRVLMPLLLGWVTMAILTGRLLPRVGFRTMILTGLTFITAGFIALARIGRESAPWMLHADLAVMGMGMGMTMLSLIVAMQHSVDRRQLGVATSFGQFTRSIGGAVGVAMLGAIVAASLPAPSEATPAQMEFALHRAFAVSAVAALLALVVATRVPGGFHTALGMRDVEEIGRGAG